MAVLRRYVLRCTCGASVTALLAESVNAGRTPEARRRILNGAFHRVVCVRCRRNMAVEKEFTYSDFGRNTFLLVKPRGDRHLWRQASAQLERNLGLIPEGVASRAKRTARVVFGLAELREKLVAEDHGLDDRIVELLKVLVVQEHPFLARKPRLRLILDRVTEQAVEFVAAFDHSDGRYRVGIPEWVVRRTFRSTKTAERWSSRAHGDASLFAEDGNHWVNMWRWSPHPSALESLRYYAAQIRAGRDVDMWAPTFRLMLDGLPRGAHLPPTGKQDLQVLFDYARRLGAGDLVDRIFEIRFGKSLEDDWALTAPLENVATLWQLLRDLPDTNVEGNSFIHEIVYDEAESGGGLYDPSTYDIHIGAAAEGQEAFEDVIRHEVGHAVQEKFHKAVSAWLEREFGWKMFETTDRGIDAWVGLMGGWGTLTPTEVNQARKYIRDAVGPGEAWGPGAAPQPPAGHPWWGADFGPRLAYERSGEDWYDNYATWYRVGRKAFFTNFWYATLVAVDEKALDLVGKMPSTYAAMSPAEFFAELYALYYDPDDPKRKAIPRAIASWIKENIGAAEVKAAAAPLRADLPAWHWTVRPETDARVRRGRAAQGRTLRDSSRTTIPVARPRAAAPAAAPTPPQFAYRPVPYDQQELTEWCWAACMRMIARSFSGGAAPRQCQLASNFTGQACCTGAPAVGCNEPCGDDDVPQLFGSLGLATESVPRALSFDELKDAIEQRRPVVAAFRLSGNTGHMIVLWGWDERLGFPAALVHDPQPGGEGRRVRYSDVVSAYGMGAWDHSWIVG